MAQTNNTATTLAETNNMPQSPEQIQGGGWTSLIPMLLIFVVFYFLLIKPQEKKRKLQEQLISTVKPGEEIVTHSGIYGKVIKVNDNDGTAIISTGGNVEMKILKSAIADIPSRKTQPTKADTISPAAKSKDTNATKTASNKKPVAADKDKTATIATKPVTKKLKKPTKKAK
jgi:preprotein translocase subunit YajC